MSVGLRVIVTGGRGYGEVSGALSREQQKARCVVAAREIEFLTTTLDRIMAERGRFAAVIHGGALGADRHAGAWAVDCGLEPLSFRADWRGHGRGAGPIRNARMISEGHPDLVIAFPGGIGTADMTARARRAGVEVIEVRP